VKIISDFEEKSRKKGTRLQTPDTRPQMKKLLVLPEATAEGGE
jgi:hypothetical protein